MTEAVRIETDSVTIQELANIMVEHKKSDSLSGAAKKAWRAWRDGLFAGARKTGKGTASIIIPAGVAERWVENGCPTSGGAIRKGGAGATGANRDRETFDRVVGHEHYFDPETGWHRYDEVDDDLGENA